MCVTPQIFTNNSLLWPWEDKVNGESYSSKVSWGVVVLRSRACQTQVRARTLQSNHTSNISSYISKSHMTAFHSLFAGKLIPCLTLVCSTQSMTLLFVFSVSHGNYNLILFQRKWHERFLSWEHYNNCLRQYFGHSSKASQSLRKKILLCTSTFPFPQDTLWVIIFPCITHYFPLF